MAPIETPSNGIPRYVFTKIGNNTYGYQMTVTQSIKWGAYQWLAIIAFFALVFAFAMSLLPFFILLAYFYPVKEERWIVNVIGIAVSAYILLDYHNGWLMQMIYSDGLGWNGLFASIAGMNIGFIIVHIILLAIGNYLINLTPEVRLATWVLILMFFCGFLGREFGRDVVTPYYKTEKAINIVKAAEDAEAKQQKEAMEHYNKYWDTNSSDF